MRSARQGDLEVRFTLRRAAAPANNTANDAPATAVRGKLPRVTHVLALAIQLDDMLQRGLAKDHADLARLGCLTRERISQIMKLLWLAPDIQREVLSLPRTPGGRFRISEAALRRVAAAISWREQRRRWVQLEGSSLVTGCRQTS